MCLFSVLDVVDECVEDCEDECQIILVLGEFFERLTDLRVLMDRIKCFDIRTEWRYPSITEKVMFKASPKSIRLKRRKIRIYTGVMSLDCLVVLRIYSIVELLDWGLNKLEDGWAARDQSRQLGVSQGLLVLDQCSEIQLSSLFD